MMASSTQATQRSAAHKLRQRAAAITALAWCGALWSASVQAVQAVPSQRTAVSLPQLAESARLAPQAITDDRGKTVLLARPPQRIVSLLPSLTESTCALGMCDRVVGVDR